VAIEHNTISGVATHEPKGVSTAENGQVYVANGAGSGLWQVPYLTGVEDYNHAGLSLSPAATVEEKVLNDGLGVFTNTTYKIPGYPDIWNTSTNQFDFSHLSLGDSVDIRFDFTVVTSGANDDVTIIFRPGVGGSPYDLTVKRQEWRTAGTYQLTAWYSVYMGDTNTLDNPAEAYVLCETGGDTVTCNGWYVRTNKQTPEFV
jgi:hypothetical protein